MLRRRLITRQPIASGAYIAPGLAVWLDCQDLIPDENTWNDRVQNLPFTILNFDANSISANGALFAVGSDSKIYSQPVPITMVDGFTIEIRIHDFQPAGRYLSRIIATASGNISNAPNFFYACGWNKLNGFGVSTWKNLRFSSGVSETFPQSTSLALCEDASGNASVYKNGGLVASGTIQPATSADTVSIGGWPNVNTPTERFSGLVKSLRVYSRVLSAEEIGQNYRTDIALFGG